MEQEREREARETRFPKNVLQIGNVSDTPKIYVEDYVNTFLNHICESTDEEPIGAFLIGHTVTQEEQECVYISGAVRMEEIQVDGQDIAISDSTWEKGREARKEYFGDEDMIGWFLILPGRPLVLNSNLIKLHEENFPSANTVLILGDALDKEEAFFVRKYGDLMHMGGHYIYYEKNLPMQNYMISSRKQNCVSPGEAVEDHAAKEFRGVVRERMELRHHRRSSRGLYAAGALLALVVLIMGITTVSNYDRMRAVQSSLEDIRSSVARGGEEEAVPTSGQAVAGTPTDGTGIPEAGLSPENDPAQISGQPSEDGQKEADENRTDIQSSEGGQAQTPQQSAGDAQEQGEDPSADSGSVQEPASGSEKDDGAESGGPVSTIAEMSADVYTVQDGDTLARISLKKYGDIGHVDAICRMNGLSDGNLIFIGQKLLLP